ncbi:hypothetical protein KU43P_01560 [Pseudomonas sp. KU43P]|nr:hypothetical protein KU43P_01560 [Pseudomonas sp. KU43P]
MPAIEGEALAKAFCCRTFLNPKPNASVPVLCRIILRHLSEGAVLAGKCSRTTVLGSPRKAIGRETPGWLQVAPLYGGRAWAGFGLAGFLYPGSHPMHDCHPNP